MSASAARTAAAAKKESCPPAPCCCCSLRSWLHHNKGHVELRVVDSHHAVRLVHHGGLEGSAQQLLRERIAKANMPDKSSAFNTARLEALELDNLLEVAEATAITAEGRKESRGAHARDPFSRVGRRKVNDGAREDDFF